MSSPTLNSCIYKSVTLAAGEQFNLPPGATLVSTTNNSAITSNCPIPPLDVTKRYRIQWELEACDNDHTDSWENGVFTGVRIGGGLQVTTLIDARDGQPALQNWLENTVNAPFINYIQGSSGPGLSCVKYFSLEFDSPSTIAESTIFYIKATGRTGGDTGTYMEIIPFEV